MAAMGDDMEKFGVWPGTYEHCYVNGWLGHFVAALEANQAWLATVPPGEMVSSQPALGRADLAACSYAEMMEWVLPTRAVKVTTLCKRNFAPARGAGFSPRRLLARFFRKYPESNLMHEKMLHVSGELRRCAKATHRFEAASTRWTKPRPTSARAMQRCLLARRFRRSLCSPSAHGLWRNLIRAETIADRLTPARMCRASNCWTTMRDGVRMSTSSPLRNTRRSSDQRWRNPLRLRFPAPRPPPLLIPFSPARGVSRSPSRSRENRSGARSVASIQPTDLSQRGRPGTFLQ